MTTLHRPRPRFAAFASLLALGLAACGGGEGTGPATGRAPVSLSVAAAGATPATAAIVAQVNDPTTVLLTDGTADTLVVTRLQLVFDEIEFERSRGDGCDARDAANDGRWRDDDDDDVRCPSIQVGPRLVDVPLGTGPALQVAFTVPAGRYEEFEFELDGVSGATQREREFLAANPGLRDVSIRIEGRWRGAPFTWTSRVEREFEFEFEPDLEVAAGVNDNVTLAIDLGAWFRDGQGRLIPPTAANGWALEGNIRRALRAFGDRDRDGDDDRDRGRGRGRGRGGDDDDD